MATHSSVLAWRIPWTDEPGRLQSMGPQRYVTIQQYAKTAGFTTKFEYESVSLYVTHIYAYKFITYKCTDKTRKIQ